MSYSFLLTGGLTNTVNIPVGSASNGSTAVLRRKNSTLNSNGPVANGRAAFTIPAARLAEFAGTYHVTVNNIVVQEGSTDVLETSTGSGETATVQQLNVKADKTYVDQGLATKLNIAGTSRVVTSGSYEDLNDLPDFSEFAPRNSVFSQEESDARYALNSSAVSKADYNALLTRLQAIESNAGISVPAAVRNVTTSTANQSLTVNFVAPTVTTGVTGYQILVDGVDTAGNTIAPINVNVSTLSVTIPNLANSSEHHVTVSAVAGAVVGVPTTVIVTMPDAIPAPDTAPTLTAGMTGTNQQVLTLGTVANATSYDVESQIGTGAWTVLTTTAASGGYTVTGLSTTTTYNFRVRARNASGPGPYSAIVTATTLANNSAMSYADDYNRADAYSAVDSGGWVLLDTSKTYKGYFPIRNNQLGFSISGVTTNQTYGLLAPQSFNTAIQRAQMDVTAVSSNATTPHPGLYLELVDKDNWYLFRYNATQWEIYKNVAGTTTLVGSFTEARTVPYTIQATSDAGTLKISAGPIGGTLVEKLSVQDGSLTAGRRSGIAMRWLQATADNDQKVDNFVMADIPSSGSKPTAAPVVTAGTTSPTTQALSWVAISGATNYKVEYKLDTATVWSTASSTVTAASYTVTNLVSSTAYNFRVTATNPLGAGPVSNVVNTTTKAPLDTGALAPSVAYTTTTRNAQMWPFTENSIWNLPISNSAVFTDGTDAATLDIINPANTLWINQGQYSHPVSYAKSINGVVGWSDTNSAGRSGAFKTPPGATRATGTDRHLHIMRPDGILLDENIGVSPADSSIPGGGGTVTRHQRVNLFGNGLGPLNGVRAYGGSAVGGLIRAWEIDKTHPSYTGKIQHPLAFALAPTQQLYTSGSAGYNGNGYGTALGYVWPATEQDYASATIYTGHVPMGAYFAIPPSVNINSLGLTTEWGLMLAKCLQDYGAYNTDTSSEFTLYVEPSAPGDFRSAILGTDFAGSELHKVINQLRRVTNNAAETPNGGALGDPRRGPTALPLAPAPAYIPPTPIGAITYVGKGYSSTSFNQNLTLTKPTDAVVGDAVYVFASIGNTKTITTPTGWTTVSTVTAGSRKLYLFRKFIEAGETSWTLSASVANTPWFVRMAIFRGVDATTPESGTPFTRSLSSAGVGFSCGPVTTTEPGEVLLMGTAFDKSVTAIVEQEATVLADYSTTALPQHTFYKEVQSATTESLGILLNSPSINGAAVMVRLNPA